MADVADALPASDALLQLAPADALELLGAGVELLVRMTDDVPPTPPARTPPEPQMSGLEADKDTMVCAHAEAEAATDPDPGLTGPPARDVAPYVQEIDGVYLRQRQQQEPVLAAAAVMVVIGADSPPDSVQHGAITRKFYSKQEPPISIRQYLVRLHQFCPMSTAVYLATSLYIHRLVVDEGAMPVTRRNAHRLVLAGLRVAMKALEDLSYSHAKMARVGGVSTAELARLEVSFCFLAGFELVVGAEPLRRHWKALALDRTRRELTPQPSPA